MPSTNTYDEQHKLAQYCRTGKNEPTTSIQEHTFHYRRLIRNIFNSSLKNAFPMAQEFIGKDNFQLLIDEFFEQHDCQTPQVWKMPMEFCLYYEDTPHDLMKEYPQLQELLVYEWLEIEVYTMPDEDIPPFTSKGTVFVPNPEIRIQPLTYPWHKKKVKQITDADKGQYIVTIHRDYKTKKVRFNEISAPFAQMLVQTNEKPCTYDDLLNMLSNYEQDETKQKEAAQIFINFCMKQGLILGYSAQ